MLMYIYKTHYIIDILRNIDSHTYSSPSIFLQILLYHFSLELRSIKFSGHVPENETVEE